MGAMAYQVSGVSIVCTTVCLGADQKHQTLSLALVRWIQRWPVDSPHKGTVTRKMFPFDDVIMFSTRMFEHTPLFGLSRRWRGQMGTGLSRVIPLIWRNGNTLVTYHRGWFGDLAKVTGQTLQTSAWHNEDNNKCSPMHRRLLKINIT